jgi:hypothetical protein
MTYSRFKSIYIEFIPIFLTSSTIVGFLTAMTAVPCIKPNDYFINTIGYTSVGIITGITYPISFPLLGVYALYKNSK